MKNSPRSTRHVSGLSTFITVQTMKNSTSAMGPNDILTLKNPCFGCYLACSCLLVIKMVLVVFLTMYKRHVHKVYMSPEDLKLSKGQGEVAQHDEVERVRRAHLNDLENIPLFWISAFAYLFTKPPLGLCAFLFFTFVIARYLHTVFYAVKPIQPVRSISFATGFFITLYMAIHAMIIGFAHL